MFREGMDLGCTALGRVFAHFLLLFIWLPLNSLVDPYKAHLKLVKRHRIDIYWFGGCRKKSTDLKKFCSVHFAIRIL